jgi:hypothetical protein
LLFVGVVILLIGFFCHRTMGRVEIRPISPIPNEVNRRFPSVEPEMNASFLHSTPNNSSDEADGEQSVSEYFPSSEDSSASGEATVVSFYELRRRLD